MSERRPGRILASGLAAAGVPEGSGPAGDARAGAGRTPAAATPRRRLIEVDDLHVAYGKGRSATTAIGSISFAVAAEELVCVVGPSGCGKTTLLRCVAGLQQPTSGSVRFDGTEVLGPPAEMAVVFQDYARSLYPWLTVRDNVLLPLRKERRRQRKAVDEQVTEALAAVGLDGVGSRYPRQLSGGMQQRVAIARAIAYRPSVLLMDEPFASVDAQSRATLEDLVRTLWKERSLTVVFVTHDIDEAVYMAGRVVVLSAPPTTVQEVVEIELGADRDQVATKALPTFAALRGRIFAEIMQQGARAAGTGS